MIQAPELHGGQINVRYRNGSVAVSALSAAMAPPTGPPAPRTQDSATPGSPQTQNNALHLKRGRGSIGKPAGAGPTERPFGYGPNGNAHQGGLAPERISPRRERLFVTVCNLTSASG
jgi:hypothetical protein